MTNTALIFDLDGTLIDSAPDLRAALNRVLATRFLPPHDLPTVRRMIGDGAKVLVERAWAAHGQTSSPEDLADFLADYEDNSVVETIVYPGMSKALAELRSQGHHLAICTNKPAAPTAVILEKLGLLEFFPVVIGGNSTPFRKPDPRHLAAAVTALGAASAIMIGDHDNDMAAASGLNIPSIFVTWGYGQSQGTYTAHAAAELPDIVKQAVLF